jgi:hypothetical protein
MRLKSTIMSRSAATSPTVARVTVNAAAVMAAS